MEKAKVIKAVGMVIYCILLNLLFLIIASGIAGSNLGDLATGYEQNSITIDGTDFSGAASVFSGITFLVIIMVGMIFTIIFSIIALAVSNTIFNSVCFKNNKYKKDVLLKDLNVVNLPIVIVSLIGILAPNIHNNIVLLMIGTTYYIVFWLSSYLLLRSKINRVN